jgi:predicted DNA binding CopG/RHH family protein
MPQKSTKIPPFRSEAEEANWWDSPEGRRHVSRMFERAAQDGTLIRGHGIEHLLEIARKAEEKALRPVSLRIPVADLKRAKKIAAAEGIGYQTVLKRAIHQVLAKNARRAG